MSVYAISKLLEDFVKVAKLAGVPMKPVLTLIYWGGRRKNSTGANSGRYVRPKIHC